MKVIEKNFITNHPGVLKLIKEALKKDEARSIYSVLCDVSKKINLTTQTLNYRLRLHYFNTRGKAMTARAYELKQAILKDN